jgi:pimeloyl-ACP methyl ester carboxylesterase
MHARMWRHHFARVEGVKLHWAELGESSGKPPLVLLHGLNDCYRSWRHVAPRLARGRRLLVPDLPGHGLSARPDASYNLPWCTHVMGQWLGKVGVDRADVVGHSLGGGIGQMMLLECRERVHRLVLVSSGGLGREIAPTLRLLASVSWAVEHLGQRFMGPFTRFAVRTAGDVFEAEDAARLGAMNEQCGSARAFARTLRDLIDWRGQRRTFFEGSYALSSLPPIAVFWGINDAIVPFSHAEAMADYVDGVRVTQFDCGHYLHHERPDAFVDALLAFLDSKDARPARLRGGVRGRASAMRRSLGVSLERLVRRQRGWL